MFKVLQNKHKKTNDKHWYCYNMDVLEPTTTKVNTISIKLFSIFFDTVFNVFAQTMYFYIVCQYYILTFFFIKFFVMIIIK